VTRLVEFLESQIPAEARPFTWETADASRDAGEKHRVEINNARRELFIATIAKAKGEKP
jgi:hypothetical protein